MDFVTALEEERTKNDFSKYYTTPRIPNTENLKSTEILLKTYTHEHALQFAAASHVWKERRSILSDLKIHAYYRVVAEKSNGHVLEACHVNVHGHHRGDLRFIELNDETRQRGNVKQFHQHGTMFHGDILKVTELRRLKKFEESSVKAVTHDTPCIWMASSVTILPRIILADGTIAMLENGTAVVEGHKEVMNISSLLKNPLEVEKLYKGTCFVPLKMRSNFAANHNVGSENRLIRECSRIHPSPNALGTVFKSSDAPEHTKMFHVGCDAFSATRPHSFSPSKVTELCVMMGYSAAVALGNGRNDSRSFPMRNIERKGEILEFSIANPKENPTENKWMIKTRIEIKGPYEKSRATIESVIPDGKWKLRIVARLSRDVKKKNFAHGVHVVCQQEPFDLEGLKNGFFGKLPEGSKGYRILETLYGGPKISYKVPDRIHQCLYAGVQGTVKLNYFQCAYIHILQSKTPMVVGSSPFGCGKSLTIITAAQAIYEETRGKARSKQLLVTQSNYASVNLVDIASKLCPDGTFKFVRCLSEKNYEEFPKECLTVHDIQKLMETVFSSWAKGEITSKQLKRRDFERMLNYVLFKNLVEPGNLSGVALAMYRSEKILRKPKTQDLRKAFFILHQPDVVMTTADSLPALLDAKLLNEREVVTIQIDEASQVPEHTLVRLLTLFPYANYGLIGDIQQLPPYCETGLDGKLKEYGVGNTMERAVKERLFPQAMLREVYRCHPKITNLLSKLFYEGKLISGIKEKDRSEFMEKRQDFWPKSKYPVLVVNNEDRGKRMGTSCGNKSEVQVVKNLLEVLTKEHNGYQLQPSAIGVISFYAAQTSVLTEALRGQSVKCGTVDAFQGTERDVIILCCTNEKISDFMQLSNRINVAMSRAKQVTIIVGNVDGLKKANYWKTIVRKAEVNGCILKSESLQTVYLKDQSADDQLAERFEGLKLTKEQKCIVCKQSFEAEKMFDWPCEHKVCGICLLHLMEKRGDQWKKCLLCQRE